MHLVRRCCFLCDLHSFPTRRSSDLREVGARARGQRHRRALGGERERDRAPDATAGAGDDGDLAFQRFHSWSPRPLLMSSMNSARVSGRSRNAPSMAEVTALEFCFSTPRTSMQVWIASITTATPRGW